MGSKRGQMQIPFGMIFSILLIIAFVAVAIYAIIMIVGWGKCASTGIFKEDLQLKIDEAWNSDEHIETFSGTLPSNLEFVCFIDIAMPGRGAYKDFYEKFEKYGFVNMNLFFYPISETCEGQQGFDIKHIDLEKITEDQNPYCIENTEGKVSVRIEKGFGDALVKVS